MDCRAALQLAALSTRGRDDIVGSMPASREMTATSLITWLKRSCSVSPTTSAGSCWRRRSWTDSARPSAMRSPARTLGWGGDIHVGAFEEGHQTRQTSDRRGARGPEASKRALMCGATRRSCRPPRPSSPCQLREADTPADDVLNDRQVDAPARAQREGSLSSLMPKTAFPTPRVNTCVPAPSANA